MNSGEAAQPGAGGAPTDPPVEKFVRASRLLHDLAAEPGEGPILLATVVERFARRAFGVLTFFAALPLFIPSPVGVGAISGALVALLGVQMLAGLRQPWLPAWLARRGIERQSLRSSLLRAERIFRWLEKLTRPRWVVLDRNLGFRISGLLLAGMGVAVALPIPLTNYPFGVVVLAFAFALVEGDGVLLLLAWLVSIGIFVGSEQAMLGVAAKIAHWLTPTAHS